MHGAAVTSSDIEDRGMMVQYYMESINTKSYISTNDIVWKNLSIGLNSKRFIRIVTLLLLVGVFILFAVPSVIHRT